MNARLKDLALETLRARKQARQLKFAESREQSPARKPTILVAPEEEPVSAPVSVEREEIAANAD